MKLNIEVGSKSNYEIQKAFQLQAMNYVKEVSDAWDECKNCDIHWNFPPESIDAPPRIAKFLKKLQEIAESRYVEFLALKLFCYQTHKTYLPEAMHKIDLLIELLFTMIKQSTDENKRYLSFSDKSKIAEMLPYAKICYIITKTVPHPEDLTTWVKLTQNENPFISLVAPSPEENNENTRNLVLTNSQTAAMQTLEDFYQIKKLNIRPGGIWTRPIPLIIGPSGVGKTTLCKAFANKRSLPFISLESGSWIVTGGKGGKSTLEVINEFIDLEGKGVLMIDELDKFSAETDWCKNIQQEVYALLDCRTQVFPGWSRENQKRFQNNFMIIGAGTWQTLHQKKITVGFGSTQETTPIKKQNSIPEELLNRFNSSWIHLDPPTQCEFEQGIIKIHKDLEMEVNMTLVYKLAAEAVDSGLNSRWLEKYASEALIAKLKSGAWSHLSSVQQELTLPEIENERYF